MHSAGTHTGSAAQQGRPETKHRKSYLNASWGRLFLRVLGERTGKRETENHPSWGMTTEKMTEDRRRTERA